MARGDDVQAVGARKRPRTSRTSTGLAGPARLSSAHSGGGGAVAAGPGMSADDLHGPINLLRVNGHRDPGRYTTVSEETQALFDKDPEHNTLVWFPAPPIDGPTQASRQRNTLLRPPIHSLDYLYERILQQQKEKELQPHAQESQFVEAEPVKSKSAQKKGKSRKGKSKPNPASRADPKDAIATGGQDLSEAALADDDAPADAQHDGEAEQLLLSHLETLSQNTQHGASVDIDQQLEQFLRKSELAFFENFKGSSS